MHSAHGPWLQELLPLFEAAWATTWGESANDVYSPLLGLPRLPVVPIGALPRSGTRKLEAVSAYVGERPCGWVDDELYDDADAWAAARKAPTMLRRTRGSVGLQREDIDALLAFGRAERAA